MNLNDPPSLRSEATQKDYVDAQRDTRVAKSGDTMSGVLNMNANINMNQNAIINVRDPISSRDIANKGYVDDSNTNLSAQITNGYKQHVYLYLHLYLHL